MSSRSGARRKAAWILAVFALPCGCVSTRESARVTVLLGGEARGVESLEDALQLARESGAERVVLALAPGVHVVRSGLEWKGDVPALVLRSADPQQPATLAGALVLPSPRWQPASEDVREQLSADARAQVRTLALTPAELAGWSGGLSGPVHSGHTVSVAAARTQVRVGARELALARWPDEGFAELGELLDGGSAPRNAEDDIPLAQRRVEPPRGARFVPRDRARTRGWAGARDAWAHGYWNWDWSDEVLPIASVAEDGEVRLALPHRYGVAARGRFAVLNVLAELDRPGECVIDAQRGEIHAWLEESELASPVTLTLLNKPLLALASTRDVRIENLRFANSRAAGIVARDVTGLCIEDCTFEELGTSAVDVEGGRAEVAHCRFERIGGMGVRLVGGDRATLTPAGHVVRDSRFTRCGELQRTYHPAIELDGVGNSALFNEISDLPHIAIRYMGNEHRIAGNLVQRVVLETGDAGAICTGRDWTGHGNVIEGNFVHSIPGSEERFQNAIYIDDMSSGVTVRSNLFADCNWGVLIGGGRDVHIEENAFVRCGKAVSYDARGVGWMAPHIADPATSTLHRRLAALPIASEPWRSRYPSLQGYLSDRFGRPVGGKVRSNRLVATPLGRIDDRECVQVEGNLDVACESCELDSLVRAARAGTVEVGSLRVGPVGPRPR